MFLVNHQLCHLDFPEDYYCEVDGEPGDGTKRGDCEEGQVCMEDGDCSKLYIVSLWENFTD